MWYMIFTLLPIKEKLHRTDWLIDQIVYKLYDLTKEEIKIVGGKGIAAVMCSDELLMPSAVWGKIISLTVEDIPNTRNNRFPKPVTNTLLEQMGKFFTIVFIYGEIQCDKNK